MTGIEIRENTIELLAFIQAGLKQNPDFKLARVQLDECGLQQTVLFDIREKTEEDKQKDQAQAEAEDKSLLKELTECEAVNARLEERVKELESKAAELAKVANQFYSSKHKDTNPQRNDIIIETTAFSSIQADVEKIMRPSSELLSIYIPANYEFDRLMGQLKQKQMIAENPCVVLALGKAISYLDRFEGISPVRGGIIVFCGNVAEDDRPDIRLWSVFPKKDNALLLYKCEQVFYTQPLKESEKPPEAAFKSEAF